MVLKPFIRPESRGSLGDREHDQRGQSSVEPENIVFLVGRADDILQAFFGVLWEQLHLCLNILSGVCDTDLDAACDTTGDDRLEGVFLEVGVAVGSHLEIFLALDLDFG